MARSSKNSHSRILPNGAKTASLPFVPSADEHLDISALETWLCDAACAIRGATDAPKLQDFVLPPGFTRENQVPPLSKSG